MLTQWLAICTNRMVMSHFIPWMIASPHQFSINTNKSKLTCWGTSCCLHPPPSHWQRCPWSSHWRCLRGSWRRCRGRCRGVESGQTSSTLVLPSQSSPFSPIHNLSNVLAFSHLTILKHGFTHVFLPHPSTFDQEVHPPAIVWRQINFLVTFESACVCLPGPAGFVCFPFFHCCAAKLETAAPPTVLKQPLTERKTVLAGRQSASNWAATCGHWMGNCASRPKALVEPLHCDYDSQWL